MTRICSQVPTGPMGHPEAVNHRRGWREEYAQRAVEHGLAWDEISPDGQAIFDRMPTREADFDRSVRRYRQGEAAQ